MSILYDDLVSMLVHAVYNVYYYANKHTSWFILVCVSSCVVIKFSVTHTRHMHTLSLTLGIDIHVAHNNDGAIISMAIAIDDTR